MLRELHRTSGPSFAITTMLLSSLPALHLGPSRDDTFAAYMWVQDTLSDWVDDEVVKRSRHAMATATCVLSARAICNGDLRPLQQDAQIVSEEDPTGDITPMGKYTDADVHLLHAFITGSSRCTWGV